jgi:hypothetical protein
VASEWLIGLFTLAGTGVGGLITSRTQRSAEDRRDSREARAADNAMLAAKRLIAGELHAVTIALLAITTDDDDAPAFRHLLSRREQWDRYGPVLAAEDSYVTVNDVYDVIGLVDRHYETFDAARLKLEATSALALVDEAFVVLDPDKRLRQPSMTAEGEAPDHVGS